MANGVDIAALGSGIAADRTGASASASLSREDFMNILLAEMSHQDPMNPVGNQEFLSQLTQLETLEATNQLTAGIETLVAIQRLASAGALIGLTVRASGADGQEIVGTVDKVILQGNEVAVSVNGGRISLSSIEEIWRDGEAA